MLEADFGDQNGALKTYNLWPEEAMPKDADGRGAELTNFFSKIGRFGLHLGFACDETASKLSFVP